MSAQRKISWLRAARKEFLEFPLEARIDIETALFIAARGGKADSAKPFKGVDGGVFEIALARRGEAFRTVYAVQVSAELWVIDAFQKKSKRGIKTPQVNVDRIRQRLKRLKETLR